MTKAIDAIVGISQHIQSIRSLVSRIADTNSSVLISGESGTGKTLTAMTIHQMSRRADQSLAQFDCAATSGEFVEVELFGHEEAGRVKRGLLETANGRTCLLENIDQIPLTLQVQFLRVLQDREFKRRGGGDNLPTDCRFIATCQGYIGEKVQANLFRKDLYYRLNVIVINLLPLRERTEDIIPLLRALATRLGVSADHFMGKLQSQGLTDYFVKYSWPGNVKELQRVVEMAVLTKRWEEVKHHLLGHRAHSNKIVIERSIEFPPEYHQAGVSILSFFGDVLRHKYPDNQATVRIEQDGLRVKMMIEPIIGAPEVFERTLDEYGLVITGRITPEEFTNDPYLVMSLKHELRLTQARIETQKELLQVHGKTIDAKNRQIDKFMDLLAQSLSSPKPSVSVTVSPVITSSVNVQLAVSDALEDICRGLRELSSAVRNSAEVKSSIEEVRQELEKLRDKKPDEVKDAAAISKLEKFLEKASDAESKIGKAIDVTERGVAIVQKLGTHYNEAAQWLGLPQIPRLLLGKGNN